MVSVVTVMLLKTLSFNVALGILALRYPIEGPFWQSAVRNWNLGQQQQSKFVDGLLRASRYIKIHQDPSSNMKREKKLWVMPAYSNIF